MNRNRIALVAVLAIVVAFPLALFGYQALRTQAGGVRVIEITARAPETGGFSPDRLELTAGEKVRLRISSPDVLHGFSIPGLGVEVKEILPGKPVEVEITPEVPGRYAFACIRWCSIDHWRMRGTIVVVDPKGGAGAVLTPEPPLYQRLAIDLDAPHPTTAVTPDVSRGRPSASRGAALSVALPTDLADPASRRTLSPAAAFEEARRDASKANLSDAELWDLVALAWLKDVQPAQLDQAKEWFAQDCAACHGPEGKGDGPAGRNLPGRRGRPDGQSVGQMPAGDTSEGMAAGTAMATGTSGSMYDPDEPAGPADFTDASRMLAMSDAALQGKILRGGMGTGMPEFGSLYTEEQLWALVAYIRTFIFER